MNNSSEIVTIPRATRGCGDLKDKGVYLMGVPHPLGTLPLAVPILPAVPALPDEVPFFRGWRIIHPQSIDLRMPPPTWWAEGSDEAEQAKIMRSIDWKLFGLPWYLRRQGGIVKKMGADTRQKAVIVYRYRLTEGSPATALDTNSLISNLNWENIAGRCEIYRALRNRDWPAALRATWHWWSHHPPDVRVDAETYRLLLILAGQEEADFLSKMAVQKTVLPARFEVVDREEK